MEPALTGRRLMLLGALQFLAGLLTGAVVMSMRNPHLGVTAHLNGIEDGLILIVMGLVWPRLRVSPAWSLAGAVCGVLGLAGTWIALTLGAAVGTGRATPLAGAGLHASPLWENTVAAMLAVSSVLVLVMALVLIVGLARAPRTQPEA